MALSCAGGGLGWVEESFLLQRSDEAEAQPRGGAPIPGGGDEGCGQWARWVGFGLDGPGSLFQPY